MCLIYNKININNVFYVKIMCVCECPLRLVLANSLSMKREKVLRARATFLWNGFKEIFMAESVSRSFMGHFYSKSIKIERITLKSFIEKPFWMVFIWNLYKNSPLTVKLGPRSLFLLLSTPKTGLLQSQTESKLKFWA